MNSQIQSNKRVNFGLILITIGTLLTLKVLNILPDVIEDFIFQWQMILILVGIFNLFNRQYGPAIVLFAIGGFFLFTEYYEVSYLFKRLFWPVALIVVGLVIIFKRKNIGSDSFSFNNKYNDDDDVIDQMNIFGGTEIMFNSQNFKGGKITNIFGGSEVNFHGTKMQGDIAVINTFTMFGGNEITVPHNWKVKNEIVSIFGGVGDKRAYKTDVEGNKVLILKGFTIFGGLEIRN